MKKVLVILILFVVSFTSLAQTKSCEQEWLIDYYFKNNPKVKEQLNSIYKLTILGKYGDAKQVIQNIKSSQTNPLIKGAALCYQANILYNESQYEQVITLCDSVIDLQKSNPNFNRYISKAVNIKAKAFGALNKYDISERLLDSIIKVTTNNNDQYNLAASYYLLGSIISDKGNYQNAIELFNKSIEIRKKINDEIGLAASFSFLGLSYAHQDNYALGIEFIQKSIEIRERIKDKRGLANSYLSLYKIYIDIGEADKAMDSEFKSLEICKEINDLQCVSGRLTNLGKLYQNKGLFDKALSYHKLALNISKQLNIKNRIAQVHENIAYSLLQKKLYNEALLHIDSSLVIKQLIGDEEGIVSSNLVLADILCQQKNYVRAISIAKQSLLQSAQLNIPSLTKQSHFILSNAYQQVNKSNEALFHYQKFIALRDSIYNIDKTKEIVRKELEFNFKRTQELQKLEQQKLAEKNKEENEKQRNIIIFISLTALILSALLGITVWLYRQKNKSEKQLEYANNELYFKNKELSENNELIEQQHVTIQTKNKEITDSIKYAQKIQSAMMPLTEEFTSYFKEAFVLFEPKDIISGDFYWVTNRNGKIIFATGDCTGHGVPGGFMSMLGVSLLNEIINEHDLTEPALILSRLRKKVITALRQKGLSGEQQDGMDMTICVLDTENKKLVYACANQFFYILKSDGTINEYKGDKQPVGIFGKELKPFKQFEIDLEEGDVLYTFSDGLADQFGGPRGKKFKYNQLKELIIKLKDNTLTEQQSFIKTYFTDWKGNLEQVDDVCLIGVKI